MVPQLQELSGMGAAYAAGIAAGLYDGRAVFSNGKRREYRRKMEEQKSAELYKGWKRAVRLALSHE
ncbi:MAG TPA: hypothetical protein DC013_02920 [Ruminococcaceae bacterium]|nr:hypothetical protein [Oscillospiraceae bacterium]